MLALLSAHYMCLLFEVCRICNQLFGMTVFFFLVNGMFLIFSCTSDCISTQNSFLCIDHLAYSLACSEFISEAYVLHHRIVVLLFK